MRIRARLIGRPPATARSQKPATSASSGSPRSPAPASHAFNASMPSSAIMPVLWRPQAGRMERQQIRRPRPHAAAPAFRRRPMQATLSCPRRDEQVMLLKIIAFIAAAIPLILLVRALFFRQPTRLGTALKEVKKQVDFAIWVFLGLLGCVAVFAAGKLIWTWMSL